MSFFNFDQQVKKTKNNDDLPLTLLHTHRCNVCPLNHQPGLANPYMEATGARRPLIYMLGEGPGADEDKKGVQFIGRSGKYLRGKLPDYIIDNLRWNNCVRCRPPDNRTPSNVEIEACRGFIVEDVEKSKPKAIFGFGNVPLYWALGIGSGIASTWRHRYFPIKIGSHTCWYFPMMHPSYVQRTIDSAEYDSKDIEFAFELDLRWAIDLVYSDKMSEPIIHTKEQALSGLTTITGANGQSDMNFIRSYLDKLATEDIVGFDYETNMLRPYNDDAAILSIGLGTPDAAISFAIDHPESKWTRDNRRLVLCMFKQFLSEAQCRKAVHSLSFEMEWTAKFFGKKCLRTGKWGDSLTQAWVLDERKGGLSLNDLSLQYFGINIKQLSNVNRKRVADEPLDKVLPYNAIDAKYHAAVYLEQRKRIKQEKLSSVYMMMLGRVPTMVLTQLKGVPINQDVVTQFYDEYTKLERQIELEIDVLPEATRFKREKGRAYRPSAPADHKALLKMLGHDVDEVTASTLEKFNEKIIKKTLEWRKNHKRLSTYIEPLRPDSPILYPGNVIHSTISTTSTDTSRTSSDSPNSQNYSKRGAGKLIRKVVTPGIIDGVSHKVCAFDYAGIQARCIAYESRDEKLLDSFRNRYDVHGDWRDRIAHHWPKWVAEGTKSLKEPDIAKKYRDIAKNRFVFPSFFGAGARSIAEHLGVPKDSITDVQNELWAMFPGVHEWHKRLLSFYDRHGYVESMAGVRRRAPISHNIKINAPIQADEAVIVCNAMERLSKLGEKQFQANLEIHDDLTFIWPEDKINEYAPVVITEMLRITFDWITAPLGVEMSIGDDWCDLKRTGDYFSDTWNGKL